VPKGVSMRLEAVNSCGSVYFGANAGPALGDLDLGTLTVTDDRAIMTLTGTVVNCNDAAVDSGYVQVILDGIRYRGSVVKGTFSMAMPRCEAIGAESAALIAGDYKTLQQGNNISVSVKTGSVDAGKLIACGSDINQYYNITFMDKTYNVTVPPDDFTYYADSSLIFFGLAGIYGDKNIGILWGIHGEEFHGVGKYKVYSSYVTKITPNGDQYYSENPEIELRPECTIKTFGAINEFITGTLVGNYRDSTGVYYPLTCDFRVKRVM